MNSAESIKNNALIKHENNESNHKKIKLGAYY